MWIFTNIGYFSAVKTKDRTGNIQVRARAAVDLDNLRSMYCPDLGPTIDTDHSDYRFRAICTPEQWTEAVAKIAAAIDYSNFKDSVTRSTAPGQGHKRHDLYMRVWSVMCDLQPTRPWAGRRWESDWHGLRNQPASRSYRRTRSPAPLDEPTLDFGTDDELTVPTAVHHLTDAQWDEFDMLGSVATTAPATDVEQFIQEWEDGDIPDALSFEDWLAERNDSKPAKKRGRRK
jgi:hypothetical protein